MNTNFDGFNSANHRLFLFQNFDYHLFKPVFTFINAYYNHFLKQITSNEHFLLFFSGKQECHENRTEKLPHLAGQTKQRLHKTGQKKDKHNGQKNNLAKYLLPSGDATQSSANTSSSRDNSCKEINFEQLKCDPEMQCAVAAGGRKRRKKCVSKKHVSTRSKRRKLARCGNKCTVVIEWLGLFEDEEAEDDSEPLVNKRSERRKKQKLLSGIKD